METEVPVLKKRFGLRWFERLPFHCLGRQPGRKCCGSDGQSPPQHIGSFGVTDGASRRPGFHLFGFDCRKRFFNFDVFHFDGFVAADALGMEGILEIFHGAFGTFLRVVCRLGCAVQIVASGCHASLNGILAVPGMVASLAGIIEMRIVRKGDRWTVGRYGARRLELDVAHRDTDGIFGLFGNGYRGKNQDTHEAEHHESKQFLSCRSHRNPPLTSIDKVCMITIHGGFHHPCK